jgi:hypothetical protein
LSRSKSNYRCAFKKNRREYTGGSILNLEPGMYSIINVNKKNLVFMYENIVSKLFTAWEKLLLR